MGLTPISGELKVRLSIPSKSYTGSTGAREFSTLYSPVRYSKSWNHRALFSKYLPQIHPCAVGRTNGLVATNTDICTHVALSIRHEVLDAQGGIVVFK